MELPSVLKKHLGRISPTYLDKLHLPVKEWLRNFFTFALEKKKNFYWAWKDFMIVIRKQKKQTILVFEIFLPRAPFLLQKHIDITDIPNEVLVNSLMFLYHHYESSPKLRRNREHSVRYLSFLSFIQMLANHDIKRLPSSSNETTKINRLLVAYIMKTLDLHNVPILSEQKQDPRIYSVSQLIHRKSSLKP